MNETEPSNTAYVAWRDMMRQQRLDGLLLAEEMGCANVSAQVELEVHRAMAKHPDWPTDPIHAFAIIAEEFGEAAKDVLQLSYEPDRTTVERLRGEVAQLAATCHRFLMSMDTYEFKPSAQHRQ